MEREVNIVNIDSRVLRTVRLRCFAAADQLSTPQMQSRDVLLDALEET